jgi:hypothetical protein
VLLAAVPSSLMLGAITYMSTDLSPIPMLWVLPLALYLLTFIIVFDSLKSLFPGFVVSWGGLPHTIILWIQPFLVFLLCFVLVGAIGISPLARSIGITLGAFFVITMACHGELARDRPSTRHLTEFYLWMSFGGMLGGMFNGLLAPTLFTGVAEYPLALIVACLIRPVLKEEGWFDGVVGSGFPGIIASFRETGAKLAKVPAFNFALIVILGGAIAAGCIYLINDMMGLPQGVGIILYGLGLTSVVTLLALRFKPNNALPFTMDVLLGTFVFILASFLIYNGLENWHWLSGDPGKNILLRFLKNFKVSGEFLRVFFYIITIGIPLGFALFYSSRPLRFGIAVGGVLLANFLYGLGRRDDTILYAGRSYFGVLRVFYDRMGDRWGPLTPQELEILQPTPEDLKAIEYKVSDDRKVYIPDSTYLMHGTTHHGLNYQHPKGLRRLATTYYHRKGPTGIIMERLNWFNFEYDPQTDTRKWTPQPQNTYHADARLPVSFIGLGAALGASNLPVDQITAAWSEPPYATVGLGTGTMASYGRPFQHVTFYEIDNTIRSFHLQPFATGAPVFNYLDDAIKRGVALEVIMGDARQSLANPVVPADKSFRLSDGTEVFGGTFRKDGSVYLSPHRQNYYHVIELDAFSSDAIPVHLITKEAIEMYFEKLVEKGVLCVHTSNRHVDLVTPVVDIANTLKLAWRVGKDNGGDSREDRQTSGYRGHFGQEYVMLARDDKYLPKEGPVTSDLTNQEYMVWSTPGPAGNPAWTDDYSNLAGALREQLAARIFIIAFVVIGVVVALILMVSKSFQ